MSVTGMFLVLFILFHMSMNITAIISPEAYNMICELLGANWYALAGTAVLALGVFVHFLYAVILTLNNYKARGSQRYAVTVQEPGVAWASKNMLVLGFIILGGLLIHLFNFWSKMQLVEILGGHENSLGLDPADGASLIAYTFSQWYYVVIYLVWFAALWFHLTHGVWSMFQTVGWANDTWYPRLKCIANIVATIIFLGFAAVVLVGLLTFIAFIFINNTIRLSITARRREIAIMRLVGASNGFIRGPFITEGVLQAILGSLLSIGVLELLRNLMIPRLQESIGWMSFALPMQYYLVTYAALILVGVIIGLFGSAIAMRRYLRV